MESDESMSVSSISSGESDSEIDAMVSEIKLKHLEKNQSSPQKSTDLKANMSSNIDSESGLESSDDEEKQADCSESESESDTDSESNDNEKPSGYLSFSSTMSTQVNETNNQKKTETRILRNGRLTLASSLMPSAKTDIYINVNAEKNPKTNTFQNQKIMESAPKSKIDEVMKTSVIGPDFEKKDSIQAYQESQRQIKKKRKEERSKTKGKNWFGMEAPEMTEEKKNDLDVLQMRRILDPKRFYKNNDMKGVPKFFQMGKVVESAADFYHARIPKKQRKATMVDELLADAEFRKYNKKKYTEIQEKSSKSRGRFKHAKRLKNKKR